MISNLAESPIVLGLTGSQFKDLTTLYINLLLLVSHEYRDTDVFTPVSWIYVQHRKGSVIGLSSMRYAQFMPIIFVIPATTKQNTGSVKPLGRRDFTGHLTL